MAAAPVVETSGTGVVSSHTTASVSVVASTFYQAFIHLRDSSPPVGTVSVSGWSGLDIAWNEAVTKVIYEVSSESELHVWECKTGASPTGGTLSITWGGATNVAQYFVIKQTDAADTGSSTCVASSDPNSSTSASTLTASGLTAAAPNYVTGFVGTRGGNGTPITEGAPFSELGELGPTSNSQCEFHWENGQTDPSASWAGNAEAAILGLEIFVAGLTLRGSLVSDPFTAATGLLADPDTVLISLAAGRDDISVPISLDAHNNTMDHSDLYRSTVSPALDGNIIQQNITPSKGDVIIDNAANSSSAPSPNTTYFYALTDWEEVGETTRHDSNEIEVKTAPARPTSIQAS